MEAAIGQDVHGRFENLADVLEQRTREPSLWGYVSATGGGRPGGLLKTLIINCPAGGGRGIRTPGTVPRTAVFKTAALNHSAIPPCLNDGDPCTPPGSLAPWGPNAHAARCALSV